jgi:predicted Zn-dependent peptidase
MARALSSRAHVRVLRSTAALLVLGACAGGTPAADLPEKARPDAEQRPPRAGSAAPWSFAASGRASGQARLANGLSLRVLERRALPLIELRLAVASGSASDADRPGVAALTLRALEVMTELASGREQAAHAESLGARLELQARRDACVIALTLPSSALPAGLDMLAALIGPPSWAPAAFEAARSRELARLQALQGNAGWLAEHALYAELFRSARGPHPYAHSDTLPGELQRLTLEDSKGWYERNFSPSNATLLAVGDVSLEQLQPLAQRALGGWQERAPAPPALYAPSAPTRAKTLLVHRAGARRSELRIAVLGPERTAPDWLAFAASHEVLAGGESSRLRRELTRRGELEVDLSSTLVPVAHGATPLVIAATASSERTGLTLAALLDSLALLANEKPTQRELRAAREQLAASVPMQLETMAGAAELLLLQELSRLPDSALDTLRGKLTRLTSSDVQGSARRYLRVPPVVVVVGDAPRLLAPLSRFGQVHLLDAQHFRTERVVSQDPTAPLEGPGSASSPPAEPPRRP